MLGDYVDRPRAPLFPFGFGLSLHDVRLRELEVDADAHHRRRRSSCRVGRRATTATRAGDEVVQLLRARRGRRGRPARKQLVGFARVDARAGRDAPWSTFTVDPSQLAYYDERCGSWSSPATSASWSGRSSATVALEGAERKIAPNDRRADRRSPARLLRITHTG